MSSKDKEVSPETSNDSAPDGDVTEAAEASESGGEAVSQAEASDAESEADEVSAEATLQARIEELEREKKETYERLLRATADLDNFRKRARRDIEDAKVDTRAKALREILPVIDNLERALAHATEGESDAGSASILEGVRLVLRSFQQVLERLEVKRVEAEGKGFDPNLHEAMSQIETADVPPGSVVTVLQPGYTIGKRLLRPALVVVAKAPSAPVPSEEEDASEEAESEPLVEVDDSDSESDDETDVTDAAGEESKTTPEGE